MTNEEFRKSLLNSEELRNNSQTRYVWDHAFGTISEEEYWEGASPGLEAFNPETGEWVTIWEPTA